MPGIKKCTCDRETSDTNAVEFIIIRSRIELRCNICNGMVGWWDDPTKKIIPYRREWSHEECLAMH
jgi:hypothetical protein